LHLKSSRRISYGWFLLIVKEILFISLQCWYYLRMLCYRVSLIIFIFRMRAWCDLKCLWNSSCSSSNIIPALSHCLGSAMNDCLILHVWIRFCIKSIWHVEWFKKVIDKFFCLSMLLLGALLYMKSHCSHNLRTSVLVVLMRRSVLSHSFIWI